LIIISSLSNTKFVLSFYNNVIVYLYVYLYLETLNPRLKNWDLCSHFEYINVRCLIIWCSIIQSISFLSRFHCYMSIYQKDMCINMTIY